MENNLFEMYLRKHSVYGPCHEVECVGSNLSSIYTEDSVYTEDSIYTEASIYTEDSVYTDNDGEVELICKKPKVRSTNQKMTEKTNISRVVKKEKLPNGLHPNANIRNVKQGKLYDDLHPNVNIRSVKKSNVPENSSPKVAPGVVATVKRRPKLIDTLQRRLNARMSKKSNTPHTSGDGRSVKKTVSVASPKPKVKDVKMPTKSSPSPYKDENINLNMPKWSESPNIEEKQNKNTGWLDDYQADTTDDWSIQTPKMTPKMPERPPPSPPRDLENKKDKEILEIQQKYPDINEIGVMIIRIFGLGKNLKMVKNMYMYVKHTRLFEEYKNNVKMLDNMDDRYYHIPMDVWFLATGIHIELWKQMSQNMKHLTVCGGKYNPHIYIRKPEQDSTLV
jgi:hypothetical protein